MPSQRRTAIALLKNRQGIHRHHCASCKKLPHYVFSLSRGGATGSPGTGVDRRQSPSSVDSPAAPEPQSNHAPAQRLNLCVARGRRSRATDMGIYRVHRLGCSHHSQRKPAITAEPHPVLYGTVHRKLKLVATICVPRIPIVRRIQSPHTHALPFTFPHGLCPISNRFNRSWIMALKLLSCDSRN